MQTLMMSPFHVSFLAIMAINGPELPNRPNSIESILDPPLV